MVNLFAFLARFLPFWAVPVAWMSFELGKYYFNQRERIKTMISFSITVGCLFFIVLWVLFDGYHKAGAWVRSMFYY